MLKVLCSTHDCSSHFWSNLWLPGFCRNRSDRVNPDRFVDWDVPSLAQTTRSSIQPWQPTTANYTLPTLRNAFAPVRSKLNVITGLGIDEGQYPPATGSFLAG